MWLTGVRGTSLAVPGTNLHFLLYTTGLHSPGGHGRGHCKLDFGVGDSPAAGVPVLFGGSRRCPEVAGAARVQSRLYLAEEAANQEGERGRDFGYNHFENPAIVAEKGSCSTRNS
jgi:hypothetical protein